VITIKQWMELINYKISDGGEYYLDGQTLYSLASWNNKYTDGGYSIEIIFDQRTQEVYAVEACDYQRNRAYRLINPAHDTTHDTNAWDDVEWIDLDVQADWLEKAQAIIAGEDYDDRVQIQLDLPHDILHELMLQAHRADMTLNNFIVKILSDAMEDGKLEALAESITPRVNFRD